MPTDTSNAIKQAAEFGITQGGQHLAALLFTLAEVHGLGLEAAQGLTLTEGFYWNRDDESRAFAKKFFARTGKMPNMIHTGTYSAVTQYLKAVEKVAPTRRKPSPSSCMKCRSMTSSAAAARSAPMAA